VKALRDGTEKRIHSAGGRIPHQFSWSPDGQRVAFSVPDERNAVTQVWILTLGPDPHVDRLTNTQEEEETFPAFSPNGKWIAFAQGSDDAYQIVVRSTGGDGVTRQITTQGGLEPDWSGDGKTLYYRSGHALFAVPMSPEEGKATGTPRLIHEGRFGQSDLDMRNYAVMPDGRVLLIEPADDGHKVKRIEVVVHWDTGLP